MFKKPADVGVTVVDVVAVVMVSVVVVVIVVVARKVWTSKNVEVT